MKNSRQDSNRLTTQDDHPFALRLIIPKSRRTCVSGQDDRSMRMSGESTSFSINSSGRAHGSSENRFVFKSSTVCVRSNKISLFTRETASGWNAKSFMIFKNFGVPQPWLDIRLLCWKDVLAFFFFIHYCSLMTERPNHLLSVAILAFEVGQKHLANYSHPNSPQTYTQPQLFACLILKTALLILYSFSVIYFFHYQV